MRFAFLRPVLALALGVVSLPVAAQKYRTAAGARIGAGNYGLTVQQRIFEKTTLEGLGLLNSREVTATVLAEQHFPLLGRSLNYYLGAGAHLGRHKDRGTVGGFDGIVGVEWKLPITPLLVSFDLKPTYEINNDDWFRFPTAVSVRYVLVKEKEKPFMGGLFGGGNNDGDREGKRKSKTKTKRKGESGGFFDGLFGN
ncbi:hypothetical protein D3Y59_14555 [Hymenobacter oligotrophus]|uniref:Outer membrane protein beta-barrel domain-containing protein n=1 Tax=Hymenobacter oligotrophus TaxID=2319843 RepID=A0A3B7R322_9BACT|nr:hypothetical protein [Hymenobacter oligotrophus]AYA38152.1 hypothetical protein D3Y59_14555 [Hymenobacter oligotrophus]